MIFTGLSYLRMKCPSHVEGGPPREKDPHAGPNLVISITLELVGPVSTMVMVVSETLWWIFARFHNEIFSITDDHSAYCM